jgi:hypothetical protein
LGSWLSSRPLLTLKTGLALKTGLTLKTGLALKTGLTLKTGLALRTSFAGALSGLCGGIRCHGIARVHHCLPCIGQHLARRLTARNRNHDKPHHQNQFSHNPSNERLSIIRGGSVTVLNALLEAASEPPAPVVEHRRRVA